MSPIEFRAPWSKTLRTMTIFSLVVAGAVFAGAILARSQVSFGASLILIGMPTLIVLASVPFMVHGYVLTDDAILVKRTGWITRLPIAGLQSVAGDIEAMRGSIRLFGNSGLFSFTGYFWNRRLGRYRALATDPDRAVVLRYPRRTIVITPHDPQHFIMRTRTLLQTDRIWAGKQR